jgi:hypothetical protein
MAKNQKLFDKSIKPDDNLLKEMLSDSYQFWQDIKDYISGEFGNAIEEWKFYGIKSGWTLKMLLKKRNLFFLAPQETGFMIAFVFGDKAVKEIEKSKFPAKIIKEVNEATKYAEGRGLRIIVKSAREVEIVKKLIRIKIDN